MVSQPHSFEGYAAVEQLVAGPMITLYCATQQLIGRKVVIKTLSSGILPDSAFGQNLEREAAILATLNHPNIVALHDLRRTEGTPWLVREWVPGWTLSELSRRVGRFTPRLAIGIASQIARALTHVHGVGIVHRGLQPDRIVIGANGEAKIINFARASGDRVARIPDLIEAEPSVDASPYVAPEQFLGVAPNPRVDVYALGSILLQLLCERLPQPQGREQNLTLPPELSPQLQALVSRCLFRQDSERFADGRAVALALDELLRAESTSDDKTTVASELQHLGLVTSGSPSSPVLTANKTGRRSASLHPAPRRIGVLAALAIGLIVLVALAIRALWPGSSGAQASASGTGRAEVRVVVEPWARVFVDEQFFDVTPFASPIVLTPGTHQFRFEHPNAPAEKRQVSVVAGESILLDVTMTIAARSGLAEPSTSPATLPSAQEPGP